MNWIRLWPVAPIALLLGALFITRATLDDVKTRRATDLANYQRAVDAAERLRLAKEVGFVARLADASAAYADRLAAREPIILRSRDTVREYASTDAGRAVCRGADRVRAIDALDAELTEDPAAPRGRAGAVRPDAAAPPG